MEMEMEPKAFLMNGAQSSFKEWTWAYGHGLDGDGAQGSFNEWTWA